jgi:hypothetical protein
MSLQGIPKLSMLAFYWGVFPSDRPAIRKALYVVTAYVCLGYTAILFDDTFYCGTPVSVQWSQEDGACSVFYAEPPFYFNTAVNLSSYIFSKLHPYQFTLTRTTADQPQSTVSRSSSSKEWKRNIKPPSTLPSPWVSCLH